MLVIGFTCCARIPYACKLAIEQLDYKKVIQLWNQCTAYQITQNVQLTCKQDLVRYQVEDGGRPFQL